MEATSLWEEGTHTSYLLNISQRIVSLPSAGREVTEGEVFVFTLRQLSDFYTFLIS